MLEPIRSPFSVAVGCLLLSFSQASPVRADEPFPHATPESVGLDPTKLERLDKEMAQWHESGNFVGGELLVIKSGKTVLHKAYGWADREARRPAEINSLWSIKSMAKPVTTTALMMLVEEGKVSLDDKLIDFIPEYVGDPRTTLANLVSHTTGYRKDDTGDPGPQHETLKDWVLDWATSTPNGTFGEYEYTDFGFAAAGYIVELVSGKTIEEFTKQRILDPLGLDDSATGFSDDPEWRARLNAWYRWEPDTGYYHLRWRTDRRPWGIYPAAWGMFSTALDYAEFASLFMRGGEWQGVRLLEEETVETMLSPHGFRDGEANYGLGWFVLPGPDGRRPVTFAHSGGDGTAAYVYPDDDVIVVFMTHSREGPHRVFLRQLLTRLGIVDAPPRQGLVRADSVNQDLDAELPDAAASYAGIYRGAFVGAPAGVVVRVSSEAEQLNIGMSPFGQRYNNWLDLAYLDDSTFRPGFKVDGDWAWASAEETFRFFDDDEDGPSLEMAFAGERIMLVRRVDAEALEAELQAHHAKTTVDVLVARAILDEGLEAASQLSKKLHDERPADVAFHENMLLWLGYSYHVGGNYAESTAILDMAAVAYPESPNVLFRAASINRRAGDLVTARGYAAAAVKAAEQQGHPRLEMYRQSLDVVSRELDEAKN